MREVKKEFKVPEARLDDLRKGIKAINKRAAKLGCEPVQLTVGDTEMVKIPDKEQYYKAYKVVVEGETPKLAGWVFQATLLHFYGNEVGNIIQAVPGVEVPKEYRNRGAVCDHCNTNRRRNKTYLLLNEAGDRVQVGSTCLGDFLGRSADNPEGLAAYCEALNAFFEKWDREDDDEGYYNDGPGVYRTYTELKDLLANTISSIREYGWTSRTAAREHGFGATADEVTNRLFNVRSFTTQEELEELERLEPLEKDFVEADAAIVWGKELTDDDVGNSDYLHNVRTLCEAGFCTHHTFGLAASIVVAYRRYLGKLVASKKAAAKAAASEHFGTVGKRENFELVVTRISNFEGKYGTTWVVGFEDKNGNQAVWFASNRPNAGYLTGDVDGDALVFDDLEVGNEVTVKATVKNHGEYRGTKQTVLTRCAATKFDPNAKEVKKVLRKVRKEGRVFESEFYWERARKEELAEAV